MLIGILSDSHGHAPVVERAFALLDGLGAEAFFHCGDVGGQDVLASFVGRRIWFVWGNTDRPDAGARAFLRATGLPEPSVPLRVRLAGQSIVVCHGHEDVFRRLSRRPDGDYLFFGHTHRRSDLRVGGCRLINPGALHRARPKTVATLDLVSDRLAFHELG
jgi:hypothetical protein